MKGRSQLSTRPLLAQLLVAIFWALLPSPVAGETGEDVVRSWRQELRNGEQQLIDRKWKRAKKTAERVLEEMCDQITSGPGAAHLLGQAALIRAVAEAGLGNGYRAHFDYSIAVDLSPKLSELDFAAYGVPTGAFASKSFEPLPEGVNVDRYFTPPKTIRRPKPKYPMAQRLQCLQAPIEIEAVISRSGLLYNPTLITSGYPVLGFAALDTVRRWRFEPATYKGEPIHVSYHLKVDFSLPYCLKAQE